MKNCLVCLTSSHADEESTCPFCGEASWSVAVDTTPEPKAKRGRKADADTLPEGKDK